MIISRLLFSLQSVQSKDLSNKFQEHHSQHCQAIFFTKQSEFLEEKLSQFIGLAIQVVLVDADDYQPVTCQQQVQIPVACHVVVLEIMGLEVERPIELQDDVVFQQEINESIRNLDLFLKLYLQLHQGHLHSNTHLSLEDWLACIFCDILLRRLVLIRVAVLYCVSQPQSLMNQPGIFFIDVPEKLWQLRRPFQFCPLQENEVLFLSKGEVNPVFIEVEVQDRRAKVVSVVNVLFAITEIDFVKVLEQFFEDFPFVANSVCSPFPGWKVSQNSQDVINLQLLSFKSLFQYVIVDQFEQCICLLLRTIEVAIHELHFRDKTLAVYHFLYPWLQIITGNHLPEDSIEEGLQRPRKAQIGNFIGQIISQEVDQEGIVLGVDLFEVALEYGQKTEGGMLQFLS